MEYLVRTVENCNSSERVTNRVFTNYKKAKKYFDEQVEYIVSDYMEGDDTLEQWLDKEEGIIVDEYGGTVSDHCVEFDFNTVELTEVK